MRCAQCGCEIKGRGHWDGDKVFCSLECSYAAAGLETDEEDEYFDEEPVDGFSEDENE
ncbi:MAG: hypothetical protein U9N55_06530 [candidate division Zixibacteria bacterium]|nr:hypothetical protein [candidate division Zixibacteria bacterium]